jgi:hypothetical protein
VLIVKDTLSENEVRVEFSFSEFSQAYIEYGASEDFGSSTGLENSFKYSTDRQWMRGLEPNTLYHYRIHGMNQSGEKTVSGTYRFKTAST